MRDRLVSPVASLLLLGAYVGCAEDHERAKTDLGLDPQVAAGQPDAASERALSAIVTSAFAEFQRDAKLRCPCHVAQGTYPSLEECLKEVGRPGTEAECAARVAADSESAELRAWFTCIEADRKGTNDCLENAGCDEQKVTACYGLGMGGCAPPDLVFLTRLLNACPGSIGFSR